MDDRRQAGRFDAHLARHECLLGTAPAWHFLPMPGTSALFETGPQGLPLLPEISARCGRRMEHVGKSDGDFAVVRLHL